MKKILSIVMVLAMALFALAGCQSEKVTTIGIIQIVEHRSLDTIRESIIDELASLGHVDGKNVKIDYQNAQGDQSNLNTIARRFADNKVDVIIAIATPSAQAAMAATETIPIVFSAVTDPVAANLVDTLENPGRNLTGTSDAIPVDQVFELAKELTPDVKTIGFLYTASEINSKTVIDQAKQLAEGFGFEYEEMAITSSSELYQVATSLANRVDAIYTPIDNTIANAMTLLAEIGRENKIPVYVGADSMVMGGSPSLSLRMGDTLFGKARGALGAYTIHVIGFIVVMLISIVIFLFLNSQTGLTIRATGDNEDMVKASSINIDRTKMIGLGLANALVGVSGALLAQAQGYVDAGMGIGMVVIGLASLIIGEVVCGKNTIVRHILAVMIGSIIYRFIIGVAIEINLSAYAMKIVSALIVVVAISFPTIKEKISLAKKRGV